ncbi:hypothetical protein [Paenirhodobacter populi]|uniref:Uncharacterized protein n=1 Tax=Paenirhodobacter populi TaxID=2306993 RepID=A0A443JCB8_9RHOB|nr:hypothetical protein [Sinirhodobacter populi]RWR18110.1 hypothetical protein D2T30_17010 [Sinirhodobacter populi]
MLGGTFVEALAVLVGRMLAKGRMAGGGASVSDGLAGGMTAAMSRPYRSGDNRGMLRFEPGSPRHYLHRDSSLDGDRV